MIIEIGDLTKVKIALGFAFGLILGIILCCPISVTNECIKHDGIIYCEVGK